ncbi:hypothetical protein OG410_39725 [Streptomyces sp. NBC_00659]|uniref:hypothetical protein n=1 Tax=Streptomyces sp. NBC_00659 TaxID=2903669 RepID=UPI002E306371|nr:hypothetical protein [Streptomyces sp. NBC_00659]
MNLGVPTAALAAAFLAGPALPAASARADVAAASARADAPQPSIGVGSTRLSPGRPATVTGADWPPGATVQAEVCGARALRGSADCDTLRAAVALVAADGTFRVTLIAGAPPSRCPCVIRVTAQPGASSAQLDVELAGQREAPLPSLAPAPRVDVVRTRLSGSPGLAELFGASPHRTLTVTVRNPGTTALGRAPLIVAWGTGGTADIPVSAPLTRDLPAGATRTYLVRVTLPAAAFGRYSVGGAYGPAKFSSATDVYPWGLITTAVLSALLLVYAIGVAARRRFRERPVRAGVPASDATVTAPVPPTDVELAGLRTFLARAGDEGGRTIALHTLLRHVSGQPELTDRQGLDDLVRLLAPPLPTRPGDTARAESDEPRDARSREVR